MKRLFSLVFALASAVFAAPVLADDCHIRDFLVKNVASIDQSDATALSFVLSSTNEEWDSAKKGGAIGGTYGLISGSANWSDSKEKAQRVAESTQFNYSNTYASSYYAQTIWPDALAAYKTCLQGAKETPGVTLWLDDREGDYLTFDAYWVGTDVKQPAANLTSAIVDGGNIVAKPEGWVKAKTEEVVVKRSGNNDVFLSLTIGDQKKSFVVVRDPPTVVWQQELVQAANDISAASHGPNPGCTAGEAQSCIQVSRPGAHFIQSSVVLDNLKSSDPSRFTQVNTVTDLTACVKISQNTGCCECTQTASGRLSALQMYPTVAQ